MCVYTFCNKMKSFMGLLIKEDYKSLFLGKPYISMVCFAETNPPRCSDLRLLFQLQLQRYKCPQYIHLILFGIV